MTATETSDAPGPRLLNERSLLGIFVHLVAILTGIVGAGMIYAVSNHEFTRENARNAFNWHLVVDTGLLIALIALFAADWLPLPGVVETPLMLLLFAVTFVFVIAHMLSFVFGLVAFGKAIFGTAWKYPLVPDVI